MGWARVIGAWYLAVALLPAAYAVWLTKPLSGGHVVGSALLGIPALGLIVFPRLFIRGTILVVGLLVGWSLPIVVISEPRWAGLIAGILLIVPLIFLIGIRRRLLKAAAQARISEHLADTGH